MDFFQVEKLRIEIDKVLLVELNGIRCRPYIRSISTPVYGDDGFVVELLLQPIGDSDA